MAPSATEPQPGKEPELSSKGKPQLVRIDASDPNTTPEQLIEVIKRDGGVIVENLISRELAARIKAELKPHFDTDRADTSGFFPTTTQRASGLLAVSDGCVELATNPLFIDVANALLTNHFSFWQSQKRKHVATKPTISSTVGFRVNPGGTQQVLHRDDVDNHNENMESPIMLGCVTALTKTTKENGATVVIPGSHKWGPDRCPYESETVPAELEPGSALMFYGNVYHAGGGNTTTDQVRETVGIFLVKSILARLL